MAGRHRWSWLLCLASLEAPAALAVPLGIEFQVNTFTTGAQSFGEVAVAGNGVFVVVWTDFVRDGSGTGIFGQRFDSAGGRVGADFQVNSYTTYDQIFAKVAIDGDGDFVVVWDSNARPGRRQLRHLRPALRLHRRQERVGVPGQLVHDRRPGSTRRWPWTPTAISSWSGRARRRTVI